MPNDDLKPSSQGLTNLQLQCLEGFWNRKPAKQIAADLKISEAWVHKNLMAARRHLNVSSSAEAAAIVFGSKPGSIKNYYYQETGVSEQHMEADHAVAFAEAHSSAGATSERPLINQYGPLAIILGIVLVALASIAGVTLMIAASDGMYQLLQASGH